MTGKPKLVFISPRFLFPIDSGGKIRTTQVLRGLKQLGLFDIVLASPAPVNVTTFASDIDGVCHRFVQWPEQKRGPFFSILRLRHLLSPLPVAVATDKDSNATRTIQPLLQEIGKDDVVVFDFPHSVVLSDLPKTGATVMFTHNVEAEIFKRHIEVAANPVSRQIWRNQYKKMQGFEQDIMNSFHGVVAVSERDREQLVKAYGADQVSVIRTGVDLDFYEYQTPPNSNKVVFTGSMDWLANIDAIEYLCDEIWEHVLTHSPSAEMTVVGRNPPESLVNKAAAAFPAFGFTGFVDDVRPYVRDAAVYAIPLRVAGGTRLKVFEAMAMGCPVVSTSIGVEGLPVRHGEHYLNADTPEDFAKAVNQLLDNPEEGQRLAANARRFVEENCSYQSIAADFQDICLKAREHYLSN